MLGMLEFFIVLFLVFRFGKVLGLKDSVFLLSYALFPIIGVIIQIYVSDVALFYVGTTLAILIIYLSIHIEEEKHIQRTESELLEANFKIMISQIQPHFLFNALTCIIDLCDTNPQVAKDTTIFFAHYLRNNLEAVNNSNQITFEQELKHIKNYLELEKVRFEGLSAKYEINASNFPVPILSIQPLVENAVKYGIGKNGNKGNVTIRTEQDSKYYYVYVIDDGAGFDVNNYKADTSRSHIGIDNCRERIVKQANGLFEINSEIGKGTTVKISIPKIY
jgi:LytS/YehU family sensor histidine kinase